MAYLRDIYTPRCIKCSLPAKVELYRYDNALIGAFCEKHGKIELIRQQDWEAKKQ